MEGNGEESNDDISQRQVGNEKVGHRLKLILILINVLCNINVLIMVGK